MRRSQAMTPLTYGRRADIVRLEGLVGLVLLLAITGAALAVVTRVPDPRRLPALPSLQSLEVLARSPNPPLDGVLQVTVLPAWLVWAWASASVAAELALAIAEHGPARGTAWLRRARAVADRLTLPLARRAVAAAMVVQLATRPPLPALAFAVDAPALVISPAARSGFFPAPSGPLFADAEPRSVSDENMIHHVVQRGDTRWSIAERYYGSGEEFDRVIDANVGRHMPDGRVFDRAALIYPGWVLVVPLPSPDIEERDGERWYVVQRRDTLSGIAARLLGDPERYHELFALNAGARVGEDGPELSSPDLIWPELRLRLPPDVENPPEAATQPEITVEAEPAAPTVVTSPTPAETAIRKAEPAAAAAAPRPEEPDEDSSVASAPLPVPTAEPVIEPSTPPMSRPDGAHAGTAQVIALAVAGGVAGLGLAGARVLRRGRRRSESHDEPVIPLDQGFALAEPARVLGQRLAGETDAATEISNRLARSFATVLSGSLSKAELSSVLGHVELVAVRHGQMSTTCVLSAPPVVRGHLLRHLEAAATGAFGDAIDFEGLVSYDGDLFIQLAGIDQRRLRIAVLDDALPEQRLWAEPLLVPMGLLYDRQSLYANWHALSNVLVAAPLGQAAETALVGLVSSLVARRSPSELALVTLAPQRTLPRELLALPHQLTPVVDPADHEAVRTVLEQLRDEMHRRAAVDSVLVDVGVVVRELADLRREERELLASLLSEGPRHRVRVLAASERPPTELNGVYPMLDEFRTRLVLQTADEDASQALLGAAGAEELGPGGNMLVRLEARTPVRAHGFRVPPDHIARMVALMHQQPTTTRAPVSIADELEANSEDGAGQVEPGVAEHKIDGAVSAVAASMSESAGTTYLKESSPGTSFNGVAPSFADQANDVAERAAKPESVRPRSDLLRQLDTAPLRLRCFGTRGVWRGERQLWPGSEAVEDTGWELVVLLGVHPVAGIQAETLADMIWDEETPPDPGSVLRKRRRRLRLELKRLVAELDLDPLPTDPKGRVYRLDPGVIASDVHKFVELASWAKSLPRSDAIAAYEEALALYRGDLLDSVAVPTYAWLYDGASLATTLRPDYRRLHEDVRLRLADLYATGRSEEELGRAVDLYTELTAERPDDDRRWTALLRAQGCRGDAMGLEVSLRRLRTALVELGQGDRAESVRLPLNVQRVLDEVRAQMRVTGETAVG
jgi:nucleoid-associated protein YgaU